MHVNSVYTKMPVTLKRNVVVYQTNYIHQYNRANNAFSDPMVAGG